MAFTGKQLKAIQWYIKENPTLRLQLSTPPNVYFKTPQNKIVSHNITVLVKSYEAWNEEDKKERSRQRKHDNVPPIKRIL